MLRATYKHRIALIVLATTFAINVFAQTSGEQSLVDLLRRANQAASNGTGCDLDHTKPPGNLSLCSNSTLFFHWRPKARFIAPEGWMNDPQGLFQREDGSFHAGYQCHPQHVTWGNISQCSASSKDLVFWEDLPSWEDPKTLYPSQIYDIRGVFDGTMMVKGWEGYPTTIYTSTSPAGPLGATSNPPETEGIETQSVAYTKDGGKSWIKLNFGAGNNPIIYEWPASNLTGFRDPYIFESPRLVSLLANASSPANGSHFLTISSGIRTEADPNGGPILWLYRQTSDSDVRGWTPLGELVREPAKSSYSEVWAGNWGTNFEVASVARLNEHGKSYSAGDERDALDIFGVGTEQGRPEGHENHWPLWGAMTYSTSNNSVRGNVDFAGVVDWGRTYAFVDFPVKGNRSVLVGWTYEDDEDLVLTSQRGYQGAFTLFRDQFVKITRKVSPSYGGLSEKGSWKARTEDDGSVSVITVGQKIIPEITDAYKKHSKVSYPPARALKSNGAGQVYKAFEKQPGGKYYAVKANLEFEGETGQLATGGFRVLASDQEWTNIYFDPQNETLVVERGHSSLIPTYGNSSEYGKLRLWPILNADNTTTLQSLNLTIVVDASVVEVYANDVTVITTRVYPWLSASKGVGFLVKGGASNGSAVNFSGVELWDGLINAWPQRPRDTRKPLLWDGPTPGLWGLWNGF